MSGEAPSIPPSRNPEGKVGLPLQGSPEQDPNLSLPSTGPTPSVVGPVVIDADGTAIYRQYEILARLGQGVSGIVYLISPLEQGPPESGPSSPTVPSSGGSTFEARSMVDASLAMTLPAAKYDVSPRPARNGANRSDSIISGVMPEGNSNNDDEDDGGLIGDLGKDFRTSGPSSPIIPSTSQGSLSSFSSSSSKPPLSDVVAQAVKQGRKIYVLKQVSFSQSDGETKRKVRLWMIREVDGVNNRVIIEQSLLCHWPYAIL